MDDANDDFLEILVFFFDGSAPPIHVGGVYPGALKRAVKYGNGWMPIGGRGTDDLPGQLAEADRLWEEAGRDRSDFEVTIFGAPTKPEQIEQLESIGVDRVVFFLPPAGADTIVPMLDTYAELIG